jgi:hypothetical protein
MLRERRRSLAKVGVFEAPRVKLLNGFLNTIGKTDLFADDTPILSVNTNSGKFHPRGSAKGR